MQKFFNLLFSKILNKHYLTKNILESSKKLTKVSKLGFIGSKLCKPTIPIQKIAIIDFENYYHQTFEKKKFSEQLNLFDVCYIVGKRNVLSYDKNKITSSSKKIYIQAFNNGKNLSHSQKGFDDLYIVKLANDLKETCDITIFTNDKFRELEKDRLTTEKAKLTFTNLSNNISFDDKTIFDSTLVTIKMIDFAKTIRKDFLLSVNQKEISVPVVVLSDLSVAVVDIDSLNIKILRTIAKTYDICYFVTKREECRFKNRCPTKFKGSMSLICVKLSKGVAKCVNYFYIIKLANNLTMSYNNVTIFTNNSFDDLKNKLSGIRKTNSTTITCVKDSEVFNPNEINHVMIEKAKTLQKPF